jgi:hypothetical protein
MHIYTLSNRKKPFEHKDVNHYLGLHSVIVWVFCEKRLLIFGGPENTLLLVGDGA